MYCLSTCNAVYSELALVALPSVKSDKDQVQIAPQTLQGLPADTAEAVLRVAKEQREEIDAEDRSQRLASGDQASIFIAFRLARAIACQFKLA